ncbi:hypothetical protein PFICI_00324 [Pestalotiopsis fici W106-1]|uniref:RING-type E3 ubiquitin transferase n=1 Tax=Pestalotiopsis fici (strain W106-1 / CGMCC3.15140) TaxID=1229662 RepID=W3XMI4_PESFW|nr:uncharacterized protein PFICI_00324 [Pestalotiopsis fici W106-1]ETS86496.1 hypothetical protein PFICI_00324 [Pestalotiopsis fici W106-1]
MASHDGEGSPPDAINADEHHSIRPDQPEHSESESESGSSYAGTASAGPSTPACPYRDSRFHDQECSRFFDCPTHLVDRVLSDDEDDEDDEHESHEQQPIATDSHHVPGADNFPLQPPEPADNMSVSAPIDAAMINQTTLETQDAGHSDLPAEETNTVQETAGGAGTQVEAGLETTAPDNTTTVTGSLEPVLDTDATTQRGVEDLAQDDSALVESIRNPLRRLSVLENQTASTFGEFPRASQHQQLPPLPFGSEPRQLPSQSRTADVVVPRWQPDSEVTSCPICHRDFSIFNRKHHCRKCGRVVCSSCSPHRITIPKEFIVRPPWEHPSLYPMAGEYGAERPLVDFNTYIGGGERVRLCNPCVPDPNVTPPQPAQHLPSRLSNPLYSPGASRHQRSRSNVATSPFINPSAQQYPPGNLPQLGSLLGTNRSRSATVNHVPLRRSQIHPPPGWEHLRTAPGGRDPFPHEQDDEFGFTRAPSHLEQLLFRASLQQQHHARTPPQQRARSPSIAEEDRCPICHHELPSSGLQDSERLREEHVASCIQEHSGSRREPASNSPFPTLGTPPRPRRATGLVSYIADEKERARNEECGICFEEYEPGVRMARLECWCRFHYDCIIEWFSRRGNARCPIHQHDSYES